MFNFFKRRPKKEKIIEEKVELTEDQRKTLQDEISAKETELKRLIKNDDVDALAKGYEELGVLQSELDIEASIESLEKSFSYKQTIGKGYKVLMRLYNQKRSEAAYKGDDREIGKWMEKMDDLRQIARNNTIGG